MTKPTGRPRGRPKVKQYVTLMARFDVALADQVKRYAKLHRQTISDVLRDGAHVLFSEHDPWRPIMSDTNGDTRADTPAPEEILSDTNKAAMALLDTGAASNREYVSDTKEEDDILSDMNTGEVIVSDTKRDEAIVSDTKAVPADIMFDTNIPPFDATKYVLGEKLCPGAHAWGRTGRTLLSMKGRKCTACQTEGQRQRREAKRQARERPQHAS
jgi:hypothetical protein